MFEQKLQLEGKLEQRQQLTFVPLLQQAMHILQLPTMELAKRIEEELKENPVLEKVEFTEDDGEKVEENEEFQGGEIEWETFLQHTEEFLSSSGWEGEEEGFENFVSRPPSLHDYLIQQLRMLRLDENDFKIGEIIIDNIDENGYFSSTIKSVSKICKVEPGVVERILEEIQKFDPPGIGARNLQEALQIQIEYLGMEDPHLKSIIQNHLKDIQLRRYDKLCKALGIDLERVHSLVKKLSALEPKPARLYERGEPHYILPDIIVSKVDEKFVVELNEEGWIPTLRISSYYKKLVSEEGDKEVQNYIKERIRKALWFVKCIEQRREMLFRIAEVIFAWQHDFLVRGPESLKPLTLKDVAKIVKLHPGTVSRATSRKFAQTPWGTFPLRYFFTGGVSNEGGKAVSTQTVKQRIKELIAKEDPSKPLSDDKIAKILSDSGISIARRTISKYREQLGILPSNLRRR